MKRTLIVGNWKMHLTVAEASLLVHRLEERIRIHRDVEVVLAPSLLTLQPMSMQIDRRKFRLCAQNAYHKDEGAFTGEVSFTMLRDLVHYALIGHSERRHVFGENLEIVRDKMASAVRNGILPILCVGETRQEKALGEGNRVVHDQLTTALTNLTGDEVSNIVVAYEPVWAISNGTNYNNHEVAKPDEVEKKVKLIRHNIKELYGVKVAEQVRILYGGSSNAENARAYLELPDVDGLLPGGASLNYHQFSEMIEVAHRLNQEKEKTHAGI